MRFVATAALITALAATAAAAPKPVPATHAMHEKRHGHVEARWQKRGRVAAEAVLPMRIGLKQSNLHKGYDLLMDVSHPDSSNFGKHYSAEDVVELFKPHDETVDSVKAWLMEHGIASHRIHQSDNKGWLAMDLTASEAESLLHSEYHEYEHTESGAMLTSCEEYHLPKHVQPHIDYITPGVKLFAGQRVGGNKKKAKRSHVLANGDPIPPKIRYDVEKTNPNSTDTCDKAITPACIKALYKVPEGKLADSSNSMGIFEEGDYYSQEDLDLFFANYTPGIPKGTHPIPAFIDGAQAPVPVDEAGGESDLDFELAYPLIWPQQTTLFQTDDINVATGALNEATAGFLNTFLDAIDGSYCTYSAYGETGNDPVLDPTYPDPAANGYKGQLQCGVYKPTNVISVSYGGQEADLPAYYQQRQCNEFMKLGLQGVSVFFASGDDGVAGPPGDDSANGCLKGGKVFSPAFPNSCPYITNVGATKVYPGHKVTDAQPESAANDLKGQPYRNAYSSGGGFSNIYSVPEYQKHAVNRYFISHDPGYKTYSALHNATHNDTDAIGANGGLYNRIGRGYPDVAANGDNIAVYNGGQYGLSGGTSASTPIFGAIINRINEERIAVGKGPVGFVNPTLYAHAELLNDIRNGSNPGCGTNGFSAVSGWDPVTGLGTPNYPKMLAFFLSLP